MASTHAHRRQQVERRPAASDWTVRRDPREPVVTVDGQPTPYSPIASWWRTLQRRKVVPAGFRIHDLRHTAATTVLRAGMPIPTAAALLGHSPAVMLSTYSHVIADDGRDLLDALDAAHNA